MLTEQLEEVACDQGHTELKAWNGNVRFFPDGPLVMTIWEYAVLTLSRTLVASAICSLLSGKNTLWDGDTDANDIILPIGLSLLWKNRKYVTLCTAVQLYY